MRCAHGVLLAVLVHLATGAQAQQFMQGVTRGACAAQGGRFTPMSSLGVTPETGSCFIPPRVNAAPGGSRPQPGSMPMMVPVVPDQGPIEPTRLYEGSGARARGIAAAAEALFGTTPPSFPPAAYQGASPGGTSVPWSDPPAGASFGRGTMRPVPERIYPTPFARLPARQARMSTAEIASGYAILLAREQGDERLRGIANAFLQASLRQGQRRPGDDTFVRAFANGRYFNLEDDAQRRDYERQRHRPDAMVQDMGDVAENARRQRLLQAAGYSVDLGPLTPDPRVEYWRQRREDDAALFRQMTQAMPNRSQAWNLDDPALMERVRRDWPGIFDPSPRTPRTGQSRSAE
jgi:hypothetical protein